KFLFTGTELAHPLFPTLGQLRGSSPPHYLCFGSKRMAIGWMLQNQARKILKPKGNLLSWPVKGICSGLRNRRWPWRIKNSSAPKANGVWPCCFRGFEVRSEKRGARNSSPFFLCEPDYLQAKIGRFD